MPRCRIGMCVGAFVVTLLAASPCYSQIGACCYPPTWECFMLTEEECSQHEGYWFGLGTDCEPAP